ncbi:uncharacterized protein LOC110055566 [Orbicella faveolata]|uniref:uncharacterized protein LOC110055566 n=1 Tax=Orbicella faveolata TaxID=48498 RepID=UPI0009E2FE81|nr:uncharacterized protein LOC110055566 [Orbicella faveolata]
MGTYNVQGSRKNVYMFRKDRDALIDFALRHDSVRQATGDLFGLWTTDEEPVIHIVCGQRLCTERGSNFDDTAQEVRPLCHIGNWRYDPSEVHQTDSNQLDQPRCNHETRRRFVRLAICIKSQTQVIVSPRLFRFQKHGDNKGEQCNLELLTAERPFKNIEGIKELALNSRIDECLDEENQMEWTSSVVSKSSPSTARKQQRHTSVSKALSRKQVDVEEIPPGIGAKQSRALYSTSNQRFQSGFASKRDFKVFMFREDYQMMENLVLQYPHLETGGNLFGLWTSNGDAVLHVVLGPGRNCTRTGASFYQDIPYLKRNGELLTQDYMLCHIGEWHSHHQLRLFEPSRGDSSTVIRNYPRGTCGFLLIIANILSPREVKLSPYLYTEKSTYGYDEMGKIVPLPKTNAFNKIKKIKDSRESGRDIKVPSQYSQGGYSHFGKSSTSAKLPSVRKQTSGMRYRTSTWPR